MNDAKCVSLGECKLFRFSLIRFRLAVRSARELIVRMKRAGGPLVREFIGSGRAHELHGAQRNKEEKHTVYEGTHHNAWPLRESRHRTMVST